MTHAQTFDTNQSKEGMMVPRKEDFVCETDLQSECFLFKLTTLATSELEKAALERAGKHNTSCWTMLDYADVGNDPFAFSHKNERKQKISMTTKESMFLTFLNIDR